MIPGVIIYNQIDSTFVIQISGSPIYLTREMTIGFVFVLLLVPLHEKVHELTFKLHGYDAKSYSWPPNAHAIAPNQQIRLSHMAAVEWAPFYVIGYTLLIVVPVVGMVAPGWFETNNILIWSLYIHAATCIFDLRQLVHFRRNYGKNTFAYMEETTDSIFQGTPLGGSKLDYEYADFELYYCF